MEVKGRGGKENGKVGRETRTIGIAVLKTTALPLVSGEREPHRIEIS